MPEAMPHRKASSGASPRASPSVMPPTKLSRAHRAVRLHGRRRRPELALARRQQGAFGSQGHHEHLGALLLQEAPGEPRQGGGIIHLGPHHVAELLAVGLDHEHALFLGRQQRLASGVQHQPRVLLARHPRHPRVEVHGKPWRQAATGDDVISVRGHGGQRVQTRLPLLLGERGPRHDEAELALALALRHREVLPGVARDVDGPAPQALLRQQLLQQRAGRPPLRVERERLPAQLMDDARDVEPASSWIPPLRVAPELVLGSHHIHGGGRIDGRIHGQRHDVLHGGARPPLEPRV